MQRKRGIDQARLQHLDHPLRHRSGCMGTLLTPRSVKSLVFVGVPQVVSAPRKLLLQLLASDPTEFLVEALGQLLRLFEIVDAASLVQLVAVATILCAQSHQPARQRTAGTLTHQAARRTIHD